MLLSRFGVIDSNPRSSNASRIVELAQIHSDLDLVAAEPKIAVVIGYRMLL